MITEQQIEQLIETEASRHHDLARVRALAAAHNADLHAWCARRRRRATLRRPLVAVLVLASVFLASGSASASLARRPWTTGTGTAAEAETSILNTLKHL